MPEQSRTSYTVYVLVSGKTVEDGRRLANDFPKGLERTVFQHEIGRNQMLFFEYTPS